MYRSIGAFVTAVTVSCSFAGCTGKPAIPPEHLERVVTLFNRGVALMDQYRPAEAVKAFDEVVRLAPRWNVGRLNLGIALLNAQSAENHERAEAEFKRVIARDPRDVRAHYALGMLLRHLARFDEARRQFRAVLEIDPEDADAHFQLAISLDADGDLAAARRHLEKTLEKVPHHQSAIYRLYGLLRRTGDKERARDVLARFEAIKDSGAGVIFGMKYGEMGRYAEVVRGFAGTPHRGGSELPPPYADEAQSFGLVHAAAGTPGWPGAGGLSAADFGPGVAAADVDGDGDLDLYIPGVGEDGAGRLYVNEGERLVARDDSDTGIDGRGAVAAYFGDHDGDGDPDLFLTRAGPNRLYRNDGGGRFADVTEASGVAGGAYLSVGAAWVDADHDGDLDLYVANFASVAPAEESTGAPNQLLQNNGDGTFTDVAATAGVYAGAAPSVAVVFLDVDADRDLDLWVLQHGSPNRLFLNDRVGRYRDGAGSYPDLVGAGPGLGALLGDVDGDGAQDIVLLRLEASPRLFLGTQGGRFSEDRGAFGAALGSVGGASSGLLEDLDLDGDLDLVLLGAVAGGRAGHRILMNRGGGRFAPPLPLGAEREAPDARGALAVDLDGDGGLELVVVRAGARPELWRAPAPAGRHWLEVIPAPAGAGAGGSEVSKASTAVGLEVEVKTGQRLQVAVVRSSSGYLGGRPPRLHFGLGEHGKADYVRLTWPDAVLQSEIEVAANQSWRVPKVIRKPSSCPLLFSWDGERFAFVTDFLGVGGLGFFVEPGSYAPPDPTEDVRIPPGLIAPRDGRYLIRVAEPLEEVSYIDELLLLAYDHPAGQEVYPDERFTATAPFPSGRPVAVREKIFPVRASVTGGGLTGRDVTDRLLEIDRRYVEPPADARFIGYADDHSIELDFGERLRGIPAGARLVLVLHGWVEYTYSHVNYAAYQAGLRMRPPAIEVPDGDGGWRVVREDVGFPAGLPRSVVIDVTSLPVRGGRLRIRTNMQVYWDQVFAAVDVSGEALRRHSLRPSMAELRPLGYPQETSPDGREPVVYDYHRLESGVAFKILTGNFTRLGDVRELLDEVDDRFVIIARGEEIALEFDAGSLPELPAGWSRTFVLRADGYSKDMDLYTAFPDTVEPLPFHAMENYPPRKPAPESAARAEYLRDWCTRRIEGR